MYKQFLMGLVAAALVGCGEDIEAGKPQSPESDQVTRPIQIDTDKDTLNGRVPPPPNSEDTSTSPGQNVPTTKPATQPAPAP